MKTNRAWKIATGVTGLIAIAAIVWAIMAMTSSQHGSGMMSGSTRLTCTFSVMLPGDPTRG